MSGFPMTAPPPGPRDDESPACYRVPLSMLAAAPGHADRGVVESTPAHPTHQPTSLSVRKPISTMFHQTSPAIEAFVIGLGAGLLYGTLGYVANRRQTGEPFDLIHYISSLAVAVVVAVGLSLSGVNPTEATIAEQMTAYAGLTYVIERFLRAIIPPEYHLPGHERAGRTEQRRR